MNESYKEQVKALQRAAGIRISEELAGYKAGVEMEEEYDAYEDGTDPDAVEVSDTPMEEKAQPVYGYDQIMNALNSVKSAQDTINSLVQDQKFNAKHKQKFSVYSKQLNDIQAALNNVASSGATPKQGEKTLEP